MLTGPKSFCELHWKWALFCGTTSLAAIAWYSFASSRSGGLLGGGSWPGLVFGVIAGLIFLFELALWPRKSYLFRTARWLGNAKAWMKAHLWLGLLTIPLVLLHSGLQFGSLLTSVFMGVFFLVIASGLLGLILQNVLPRMLLKHVPAETVATQIDHVARQYAAEARQLVMSYCEGAEQELSAGLDSPTKLSAHTRVQLRQRSATAALTLNPARDRPRPVPAPELICAVANDIEPFLTSGKSKAGLGASGAALRYFSELKEISPKSVCPAIDALEQLCERRRQLSRQARLQFWLQAWLAIHLPLSIALILLLAAHVYFALRTG